MITKLQDHLEKILELKREQQIFILDDTLYTFDLKEERMLPVENVHQKTQMYINGKPIDIWKNQVQFIEDNPPENEYHYTKLELVNFWFEKKLSQGLLQMFYRNMDGKIDIPLLRIMFFRVLEKEGSINANTLAKEYQGLYEIYSKNRSELGDSLEIFLTDLIGIDEDLVFFEASNIHFRRGKVLHRQTEKLFNEYCKGVKIQPTIITGNQYIRPDATLLTDAMDFKLSALCEKDIFETKEYLLYRKHFKDVYILYLFGPRNEKYQKDNVIHQSLFTWIEENKLLFGEAYNKVLGALETIACELDLNRFKQYEEGYVENILQITLDAIQQEGITKHSQLAERTGYAHMTQVLSGTFFKSHPLSSKVVEAYCRARAKESNFFAIDVNGKFHGPFLKYKECFNYLKQNDVFYKHKGEMGTHGPSRCLYQEQKSYKGFVFIRGSYENIDNIKNNPMIPDLLSHAKKYLKKQHSILFEISEASKEIECYSYFNQIEQKRNVDKRSIQESIKNGQSYKGYQYYQIIPKHYSLNEIRKLKQQGINLVQLLRHFKRIKKLLST